MTMMLRRRTIHIVDDDAAVRRALDRLIRSAGFATALYDTSFALLQAAPGLQAASGPLTGCILLDIRLPGMDGLELQVRLRDLGVDLPVVAMTGDGDVPTAVRAMKSGAYDFLEKPFSEEQLFDAIEAALSDRRARAVNGEATAAAARIAELSPREREVLAALTAGHAQKTIAHELGISVRTVEVHRARMLRRLGTRRLAEAIRLAVMAELDRRCPA
jgi:two-component system response regulator FixJ